MRHKTNHLPPAHLIKDPRTLMAICAATIGMCVAAGPAVAAQTYLPDFSFGAGGVGIGEFALPTSIAIDQVTHDVYVADAKIVNGGEAGVIVHKFDAAGRPVDFANGSNELDAGGARSGDASRHEIAVDNSNGPAKGDLYVANGAHIGIYNAKGEPLGALDSNVTTEVPGAPWEGPLSGVAVDPLGNVYVRTGTNVNRYTPKSNPVLNTDYTSSLWGLPEGGGLAADVEEGKEVVYTAGPVVKYEGQFETPAQFKLEEIPATGTTVDPGAESVTVDPPTHDAFTLGDVGYPSFYGYVAQYSATGTQILRFTLSAEDRPGIAVDEVSKEIYASILPPPGNGTNGNGLVEASKLVTQAVPTVNDQPPVAGNITRTSVTLRGTINPGASDTTYHFLYIDQAGYEKALAEGATDPYAEGLGTATLDAGGGLGDITTSTVAVNELSPATSYHYALVAANALDPSDPVIGPDYTFTTGIRTPPIVVSGDASAATQNAATLTGTVDTQGLATSYGLEIGLDTGYGAPIPYGTLGGSITAPVNLSIEGLQPATTYHYRVYATNQDGTSHGADRTFTTPAYPVLLTAPTPAPPIATPNIAFPTESTTSASTTTVKALTNAQKLAKALKACRKERKGKRAKCEKQARRRYVVSNAAHGRA
jgi:hypothetical protein